ncbi:MAG: MBL fold metallo-hydrolase [Planctomycetota bacterium]|nr:MAG: MBL fold metallo-hydrolase [Planctomycetota bacterium]
MLKLTVLGAGTILPRPEYSQSGYLVELATGEKILLDCGAGTILRLTEIGIAAQEIDFLFFTHSHLDHTGDFPSLLWGKRHPALPKNADLTVYYPPKMEGFYENLTKTYGHMVAPSKYQLKCHTFPKETGIVEENFRINAFEMDHMVQTYGYRLETNDGVIAYCGDSDKTPELIPLGKEADILILECAYPDHLKTKGHLSPSECGQVAAETGCKHLVLTHFYPWCLEDLENVVECCRQYYSGKLTLAKDKVSIEVP